MNLQDIIIAVLIATVFSSGFVIVATEQAETYNKNLSHMGKFEEIKTEQDNVEAKANDITTWLQDLGEGDAMDFVFAMPTQIANILVLLVKMLGIVQGTISALLSGLGIPNFIQASFSIIITIIISFKIIAIWSKRGAI